MSIEKERKGVRNMAGKKVFVGMSGGVDSSVSAALLKRAGYDVTGVFIKVWQPDWIKCTWKEDRVDAMRVAATLGIPFITLDLEEEYKRDVIDYMIAEYKSGRVPNPDVMCNRHIKFGAFYSWAVENGADHIATGHYAQIKDGYLTTSTDSNKDQTYFLWSIKADQLKHILFPVGGYNKADVRRLAKKFTLPNADKKDSQGLCFVGKIDFKDFLSRYIETKPGIVLDENSTPIGKHTGALFFTLGERHGFTIDRNTPDQSAYYVVDKNIDENTITVSASKSTDTSKSPSTIANVQSANWNSGDPTVGKELHARVRYRGSLIKAVMQDSDTVKVYSPRENLVPGQSLVLYDGDKCLGGGIIS